MTAAAGTIDEVPFSRLRAYLEDRSRDGPPEHVGYSSDLRRLLGLETEAPALKRPATWISRARCGIVATGSVLVAEREERDRIGALLCTRHVLLLPADALLDTPADVAGEIRSCVARGLRFVTLVTGPSRTSDIEKVLTLGAHGPRELEIVLVEGWEPADD